MSAMDDKLIVEIMVKAKEHFGRKELAEKLGLTANQVTDISAGRAALPFVAALKLAELLQVEPLPLLCANESLMEKNEDKKTYLKSFFAKIQMAHNLYYVNYTIIVSFHPISESTVLLKL
ncbi:MAG: hypothetical protein KKG86_02135 [Gammaproteobacteria bacterium]|nr:hypothetical protein [Gammaproteobacteria bacterium]MBU2211280.1 hypothetical protein [Gammaproteobacteria bacterium]